MLYFKTRKGRLIIEISIDENEYVYMLIYSSQDKPMCGYYSWVNKKVWEKFRKISEPQILEQSEADYEIYNRAIENENAFQQEMADWDWLMSH